MGHICLFSWVRPVSINTYAATPPVILCSSQYSHRFLVHLKNTRSDSILSPILALCGLMKRPLWLNTRSTGAEVACAEDPLEEAMQDGELRLMLHSFPRVSVTTKSQGYLRFWVQSPKQGLETFFQRPRPRSRTSRGQGHVLEESEYTQCEQRAG